MTLDALIRDRRAALGLSLQAVAERAGLTKSHVWELERGRSTNPTVRALYGLSVALRVSPTTLFRAALAKAEG